MAPRLTDTQCARCDRMLGTANTNPDRLCGPCQRELASHHAQSRAYAAWLKAGRPREIHRTPGGRPVFLRPSDGESDETPTREAPRLEAPNRVRRVEVPASASEVREGRIATLTIEELIDEVQALTAEIRRRKKLLDGVTSIEILPDDAK